jgi:type III secretion protein S
MFVDQATRLMEQALWLVLALSAPPIAAAAVVGLVVAILQSVTQLQEQTVQYAAKFLAISLTLLATMAVLGSSIYNFSDQIFSAFPALVR